MMTAQLRSAQIAHDLAEPPEHPFERQQEICKETSDLWDRARAEFAKAAFDDSAKKRAWQLVSQARAADKFGEMP